MIDIEQAKLDPASIFKKPHDVLKDNSLSRSLKIEILERWAYDEREMSVAEEENMQSSNAGSGGVLDEILQCLMELGVDHDERRHPPTKQG